MAKRLVLEQHDLCTIWSTENIVSGLMEENGFVFFFSPLRIFQSLSWMQSSLCSSTRKGRQQVWGSAVLAVLVIQPWQWITGAAETYLPTSLRMLGKSGWGWGGGLESCAWGPVHSFSAYQPWRKGLKSDICRKWMEWNHCVNGEWTDCETQMLLTFFRKQNLDFILHVYVRVGHETTEDFTRSR